MSILTNKIIYSIYLWLDCNSYNNIENKKIAKKINKIHIETINIRQIMLKIIIYKVKEGVLKV